MFLDAWNLTFLTDYSFHAKFHRDTMLYSFENYLCICDKRKRDCPLHPVNTSLHSFGAGWRSRIQGNTVKFLIRACVIRTSANSNKISRSLESLLRKNPYN